MLALHVRHLLIAATLPLGACVDNTLYPAPLPAYQPQATASIVVPGAAAGGKTKASRGADETRIS